MKGEEMIAQKLGVPSCSDSVLVVYIFYSTHSHLKTLDNQMTLPPTFMLNVE